MANSPEKTDNNTEGTMTLASLLQDPFALLPKNDEKDEQGVTDKSINSKDSTDELEKQKSKEKELELDYDSFGNVNPMSAFLGPKLWDDTMLYGDENLKFEFMDIDEFLNEHGILGNNDNVTANDKSTNDAKAEDGKAEANTQSPVKVQDAVSPQDVISMVMEGQPQQETLDSATTAAAVTSPITPATTPPREPSPVTVSVSFELSHTDIALATIPGEDTYDPRSKQFTDDELKPQPMIKKSKKVFVPDEQKDDKYWERRRKNNVAAKRSRDARRVKENQIVLRAAYLEKENGALKQEVVGLKKDNMSLKSVVAKLEKELKEAMEKQQSLL